MGFPGMVKHLSQDFSRWGTNFADRFSLGRSPNSPSYRVSRQTCVAGLILCAWTSKKMVPNHILAPRQFLGLLTLLVTGWGGSGWLWPPVVSVFIHPGGNGGDYYPEESIIPPEGINISWALIVSFSKRCTMTEDADASLSNAGQVSRWIASVDALIDIRTGEQQQQHRWGEWGTLGSGGSQVWYWVRRENMESWRIQR